jgi:hypothetical protein
LEQRQLTPTRLLDPAPSAFGVGHAEANVYKRELTDDISRNCSGLAGGDTSSSSSPCIIHLVRLRPCDAQNTKHHKHRYLSHPRLLPPLVVLQKAQAETYKYKRRVMADENRLLGVAVLGVGRMGRRHALNVSISRTFPPSPLLSTLFCCIGTLLLYCIQ